MRKPWKRLLLISKIVLAAVILCITLIKLLGMGYWREQQYLPATGTYTEDGLTVTVQNTPHEQEILGLFPVRSFGTPFTLTLSETLPIHTPITKVVIQRLTLHSGREVVKVINETEVYIVDMQQMTADETTPGKGFIYIDPTPFTTDEQTLTVDGTLVFISPQGRTVQQINRTFTLAQDERFVTGL